MKQDIFMLGGQAFHSRFILGSGKYNVELIKAAVEQAGAQIITLAVRRANSDGEGCGGASYGSCHESGT